MSDALHLSYLARHGETAWTISRQHTSRTDLPLTPEGETQARRLSVMGYEHNRCEPEHREKTRR